jgi:two-component system LytT family response regulator
MKALIVDDEQFCRNNLKLLLDDYCPEIRNIDLAESAEEARKFMMSSPPDILFLDIKMPQESGFDLLASLENKPGSIVFTTAHNEFALEAIKAEALDYLEKPIDIDDLRAAVQKASRRKDSTLGRHPELQEMIREASRDRGAEKLAIPMREGYELIPVREIIHLEASESYTLIHLNEGKRIMSSKNIKVYEEKLDPSIFFRTHKSHIVNVKYHLKGFSRVDGNSAVMSNGKHIPISRRKLQRFLEEVIGSSAE